jgi:hypothetical protein
MISLIGMILAFAWARSLFLILISLFFLYIYFLVCFLYAWLIDCLNRFFEGATGYALQ